MLGFVEVINPVTFIPLPFKTMMTVQESVLPLKQ